MTQNDALCLVRSLFGDSHELTLALYRDAIEQGEPIRFRSWLQAVWYTAAGGTANRYSTHALRKAGETVRAPAPLPVKPW